MMENQVIREVLQKIVAIDEEAKSFCGDEQAFIDERDIRIKHELREVELQLMRDVRKEVKTDYNERMKSAEDEKKSIEEASNQYQERVMTYFHHNKHQLVDELFADIFGELG